MSTAEGPFPMQTTYTWADAGADATRMALRNRGQPTGFAKIGAPVMAAAMRRANAKDLRRLKEIREGVGAGCGGCPTSGGPLPSRWKFTVTTATR